VEEAVMSDGVKHWRWVFVGSPQNSKFSFIFTPSCSHCFFTGDPLDAGTAGSDTRRLEEGEEEGDIAGSEVRYRLLYSRLR
jgi:hypothetical protein